MRVVLADPPKKEQAYHLDCCNLGIVYLIGYLRSRLKGVEVFYLEADCDLDGHLKKVAEYKPDLYGLSFTQFSSSLSYRTINAVKEGNPHLPIICGGPHPTAIPEQVFEKCGADLCVLGEGEETLLDLVRYYDGRSDKRLEEIEGIAFVRGNKIVRTPRRPLIKDLDTIPHPAWDVIDFSRYLGIHLKKASPQTYVLASRGCPFDCSFCSNPVWRCNTPWVRLRSPKNIAEEIDLLYERGVREIYLAADEFNVNLDWAIAVCNELAGLNYKDLYFQCNLRADKVSDELVRSLESMNCWLVHVGIESGNQRVLDGIGKKITLEGVVDACKMLREYGIKVYAFMMLYQVWEEGGKLCWETQEEVDNTIAFTRKLFSQGLINYMSWQFATPTPGARLWDIAKKHNLMIPNKDIDSVRQITMDIPGISKRRMERSMKRGIILKNYYALRSGNIGWRHWQRIRENVATLLTPISKG